jgi:parallel beta-helix repeat protein
MSSRVSKSLWNLRIRKPSLSHSLHHQQRFGFERLEDRRMLATLWVDPNVAATATIFSSIGAAVIAAHNGDTIKVVAGTYEESVDVNKSVTLIGGQVRVAGQSGPSIIDTPLGSNSPYGFFLEANHIAVKNFTIRFQPHFGIETSGSFSGYGILHNHFFDDGVGVGLSTSSSAIAAATTISANLFDTTSGAGPLSLDAVLSSGGLSNVTLSGNTINESNTDAAIRVNGATPSTNVRIMNNTVILGQGIVIANVTKAKIDGNIVLRLGAGATAIHLAGAVTRSEVNGNTLFGGDQAGVGIHLDQMLVTSPDAGNKISGNTLTGVGDVFNVLPVSFIHGIELDSASQNTIIGNSVTFAVESGIALTSSDSNTISSNSVSDTGLRVFPVPQVGISLSNSDGNVLSKNITNGNKTCGILIDGSSGNMLKQNTADFNDDAFASGIQLQNANQNKLIGNTTNFNTIDGISFAESSGNVVSGNSSSANLVGFDLTNASTNTFSGNTASGNFDAGFGASNMSNNNTFMKNTVNNTNTVTGSGSVGIEVSGNSNVVKGNMVIGTLGIGIVVSGQMATVSNNIVKNNQGDGIQLSQLTSSLISGNVIMNNDGDGIDADATTSGNTISGNMAMGNGQAVGGFDLFDASTGTGTAMTANTWLNNKAQTRSPARLM